MEDFPELRTSAVIAVELTSTHLVLTVEGPELPEPEMGVIKEEIYVE